MINTIIFDLGAVLIDWNPRYLYRKLFTTEREIDAFLANVCTFDWNEQQDGGRLIEDANTELIARFPEQETNIRAFYGRWEEMLGGPIHETVEIFRQLNESGNYRLYALTNWSAETFPIALARYDFLHWFDGIVVSGTEKMKKPAPEFYQLLLDRYAVSPSDALFIDDNLRNVEAAKALGIPSIRYTGPSQLASELSTWIPFG